MSSANFNSLEMCIAEAAKARAEAEATNLPRVREQLLRSAQAWEAQAAIARRFAHLPSHVAAGQAGVTLE
jgi:hypothetical protein